MEQQAEQQRMEAFRNAPLKVGEKVRVKENGMVGEVVKVSAKAIVVVIGNISSKMPLDKVERITSNEFKSAVKETARPVSTIKIDSSINERKLNFSTEIDIRGERLNDAVETVTRYIDDAIMFEAEQLLLKSDLTVLQISERFGFCDQFYFSRRFKMKYGETPQKYRKLRLI